jgi:NAD(P)H dehydrogenase (quinone)
MQNLLMFLGLVDRRGEIRHWVGDERLGWIDAGDIAAVAAAVLRDPRAHAETYLLATEQASMADIAALLSKVTGAPWRYEPRQPAFIATLVRLLPVERAAAVRRTGRGPPCQRHP